MTKLTKKATPKEYQRFLDDVVTVVHHHRGKAVMSVQALANQMYWHIGELIIQRQAEFGWGKAVIEQLSIDLNHRLGEGVSWSPRNLRFMRQLVEEYSNVPLLVSHLRNTNTTDNQPNNPQNTPQKDADSVPPVSHLEALKQLIMEVPWGHNILILQKVKNVAARIFYLQMTIKNKYSRAVLLHQIAADAHGNYHRHRSQHNFAATLPSHLQEQTQESIKSVYVLDFLDANQPISERELERTMVEKFKRLMMELGYGFCFIGNQYRISLGEKDYYIDLLFYHRILKCLVAVDLKISEFAPEFVGKLDFYLQLVDEQFKQPDDRPSIGILLVPQKDQLEVEYALRTSSKPIGVAQYTLSKQLPNELIGMLPTSEEFNQILNGKHF